MAEIVKEFIYRKSNGEERKRKVLVLSKDSSHLYGLDLDLLESKLGKEEVDKAIKCIEDYYKSLEDSNNNSRLDESTSSEYPNYDKSWSIAYRNFKTSNIFPIPTNEDIDLGVLNGKNKS